jgi:DNA-binding IclR family transcriptional regulator
MQSIERVVKILSSFSLDKARLSLDDLTKKSGLPKATVYRIAEALCREHMLEKDSLTSTYRIGIKLFELGSLYLSSMRLKDAAFIEMERLHSRTGETIHMGILDGMEVVSIEGFESSKSLHTRLFIGRRAPIYCTAVGKAILAFLPDAVREEMVEALNLVPQTSKTITDKCALREELEGIRSRGTSFDRGENEEGVACVGAPIFDSSGDVVASISISGPIFRMGEKVMAEYSDLLKEVVERISSALGHGS